MGLLFLFLWRIIMHIKTKNKEIDIPGWALLVGIIVVYNAAKSICKETRKKKK